MCWAHAPLIKILDAKGYYRRFIVEEGRGERVSESVSEAKKIHLYQ